MGKHTELGSFDRVKRLISRIAEKDRKVIVNYLNAFDSGAGKEVKTSLLFNFMITEPAATEEKACYALGCKKTNTFQRLVERLREKIGYVLSSELITQRSGEYSKRYRAIFQAIDRLKRAHIYMGKINLPDEAFFEINKVIELGKTYEIYPQLVEALYLKMNYIITRQLERKNTEALFREIEFYSKCREAVQNAKKWHNKYVEYGEMNGYRNDFTIQFEQAVNELERDFAVTNSENVAYYYYIIKMEYLQEGGHLKEAEQAGLKLLNLVENSKVVYMPLRMGTSNLLLADNYLYQRRPKKCLEFIMKGRSFYFPNSYNFSLTEEIEFWCKFYSGEYRDAAQHMNSILSNVNYSQSAFIDNKRKYFYACALFACGRLTESARILESIEEIHIDKKGWNVGLRIMSLLITLCYNDREELTIHKLDAFRKHIYSLERLNDLRKRDILIFQLLKDLVKYENSFTKVYKMRKADFDLLEGDNADYAWQIKSHELIIFPIWFKCMAEGKPYFADLSLKED